MKVSAMLQTSEFRGDHSADISIAIDVDENTTLGELVQVLNRNGGVMDRIEVRMVQRPNGTVAEVEHG